MPNPKISAKELADDIRGGMNDAALAEKYKLSAQGLQSIFNKLIAAGALQQAELDDRASSHERTVNLAWKCPACGKPQPKEFEVCPDCGVIVSRFLNKQQGRRERESVDQFVKEQVQQEKVKTSKEGRTPETAMKYWHKLPLQVEAARLIFGVISSVGVALYTIWYAEFSNSMPGSPKIPTVGWLVIMAIALVINWFFVWGVVAASYLLIKGSIKSALDERQG